MTAGPMHLHLIFSYNLPILSALCPWAFKEKHMKDKITPNVTIELDFFIIPPYSLKEFPLIKRNTFWISFRGAQRRSNPPL
jgi:hypothetical protein